MSFTKVDTSDGKEAFAFSVASSLLLFSSPLSSSSGCAKRERGVEEVEEVEEEEVEEEDRVREGGREGEREGGGGG